MGGQSAPKDLCGIPIAGYLSLGGYSAWGAAETWKTESSALIEVTGTVTSGLIFALRFEPKDDWADALTALLPLGGPRLLRAVEKLRRNGHSVRIGTPASLAAGELAPFGANLIELNGEDYRLLGLREEGPPRIIRLRGGVVEATLRPEDVEGGSE